MAMPALAVAAESAQGLATHTRLTAETRDQAGRTLASVAVTVLDDDGQPATGAVAITDHGKPLAGAALNAEGQAKVELTLAGGDHLLRAAYTGDETRQLSTSAATSVHGMIDAGSPDFQISVAPATLSLTAGQSGSVVASVTPVNGVSLTAPMFVTLSCSGFPDQSSCSFTPQTVEILPNAVAASTSTLVMTTQAASSIASAQPAPRDSNPIAWSLVLPGILGLGGLAWGGRNRRWLLRLSLVAMVALVTMLGTTGCNPRYYYFNHGPPTNPATPTGSYTLHVTAQSSNGVTAITHSTTLGLTVK